MAAYCRSCIVNMQKAFQPVKFQSLLLHNIRRNFGTSTICRGLNGVPNKNLRAGKQKISINKDKPLTYEQTQPPNLIGVTKSWNSWNSGSLEGEREKNAAQIVFDDIFIRKFMYGTWHNLFASEVIIKRQYNQIIIAGLIEQSNHNNIYFLIGYTEELLSFLLKCPVKVEIQTVADKKDLIFRYI
ncbi:hypothetical protein CHS0354_033234 [Potamilus streckersoni]|uniref:Ribosomal protein S24 n=1 Tax=Potamilus streckersoni TaxID=2493646 RepID=A0AAE0VQD0_9BIVA|nr:hypothetical protein CHS0354_033234 [Potamilus streckersoni]